MPLKHLDGRFRLDACYGNFVRAPRLTLRVHAAPPLEAPV